MSFFTQKLEDSLNEPARISFLGPKYVVDLYRSSQRPVRLREGFPLKVFDGTVGGFRTIHDEFSAELQPRNAAETESKKLLLHILRYLEENPRPCVAFEDIYIIENGTCLALIKNPQPIKVISLPLPETDPEDSLLVEEEEEKEAEEKVPADVSSPALSDPHPVVVIEDAPADEEVSVDVPVKEDAPVDAPSGVVIEDVPADDQQVDHEKVDVSAPVDPKEDAVEDQAEKEGEKEEKKEEDQEDVAVVEEEKALEETEEEEQEEEEKPVTKLKSIVVHVRKERKISISTASLMGVSAVLYALFYTFAPHDIKT